MLGEKERASRRSRSVGRRGQQGAGRRGEKGGAGGATRAAAALLALATCMLPPVFISDPIGYVPLIAYVTTLALDFAYLRILSRAFSFSEDSMVPSCERESEVEFVVGFSNGSPLVFFRLEPRFFISDLFGEVVFEMPATMTLMPFEKRDFRFQARFDHVGSYTAGVSTIVIGDLLGLFSKRIENGEHHQVEVLPRLFDVSRAELANVSVQESNRAFQPLVTDDMDYAGVREYRWGDPLKTIHWKLSARADDSEYYTRLFETFSNPGLSIIIDPQSEEHDSETLMFMFDALVESALSINDYAHQQGVDSAIAFPGEDGEAVRLRVASLADFETLVNRLPRIGIGSGDAAFELLRREGNALHGQDNIAFVTAHVSDRLVSTLVELKMRKKNPMAFVVLPRGLTSEQRSRRLGPLQRLGLAGIVYYAVDSAADLANEGSW